MWRSYQERGQATDALHLVTYADARSEHNQEAKRAMTLALRRFGCRPPPSALRRSGSYVMEGHRLFRVVSEFAFTGDHVVASLEDCFVLDVHAYAPGELCEMGLRPVRTDQ